MNQRNAAEELVDTLFTRMNETIPEEVKNKARICLLDEIGAILAGVPYQWERVSRYLGFFPKQTQGATVIGRHCKATLQNAALVNALCGHAHDIDDGHRFSTVHLGSTVIPAVLAVAEQEQASMDDVYRGIILGYECAIRLSRAIQPSHRARGFHSSGTVGAVGAAIGAAALLKLPRDEFKAALAAGLSSAGGINEMMENVSTMKPFNVARAAHDGITAAYIGHSGFTSPIDPLWGKFGFLRCMADEVDDSKFSLQNDPAWNILGCYHKPYASCRHTHGAVSAADCAVKENGLDWHDIAKIDIKMYGQGVKGHQHIDVPSPVAAKMSTPFCIGTILKTGKLSIRSFCKENMEDPEINALAKLVTIEPDEEMTKWVPQKRAACAAVTMKDGKTYRRQMDYSPGEPEQPLTREDFLEKFRDLCEIGGKTRAQADELSTMILDKQAEFRTLMARLA